MPIPLSLRRRVAVCSVFLLALLVLPRDGVAQPTDEVPDVTRTFALVNARVVQAPGRVMERATVIVRDGLIATVSRDAKIPFDAERIEADSLTVYAGFIDGLSHTGIPKPKEDQNQERPDNPGNPPDEYAGIQPERDARMMLDAKDSSIEKLRQAGFTAAHVVPYGNMLPGSGAVILLAGDDPRTLVLKGDASVFAQFAGARRVYPATDMAVMAKMRQLYREAERRQRMEKLYTEDPTGLERPEYDPAHYAFFPVLDGEKSVYFNTDNALDVYRALELKKDVGLPLVLTGLNQSYDVIDALREADVPMLLTLDLPEKPKDKKQGDDKPEADSTEAEPPSATDAGDDLPQVQEDPASDHDANFRTRSHADVEAEKENLEARQAMERAKYYGTASALNAAGLTFGFTTMDTKPEDVMTNVRTMIENGLPEDVALAALTTNPARILGLSESMGTVEQGKMANLVLTSGPLFEEDSKIRYVFVDGRKFEMEAKKKKKAGSGEGTANPAGVWSYTVSTPQGEVGGTISLQGEPGNLTGTITNDADGDGPADLEDLEYDGGSLSFAFDAGQFGRITADLTLDGEEMEGALNVPGLGSAPLTGSRTSGPEF